MTPLAVFAGTQLRLPMPHRARASWAFLKRQKLRRYARVDAVHIFLFTTVSKPTMNKAFDSMPFKTDHALSKCDFAVKETLHQQNNST